MTIRVYTKPACMQCEMTKRALTNEGLAFELEDITDPMNLEAAKALGHTSAPVVVAGDESWAGFQPEKIKALAERVKEAA